jgi:NAD+ synthase (glutamine-hydrolysing)
LLYPSELRALVATRLSVNTLKVKEKHYMSSYMIPDEKIGQVYDRLVSGIREYMCSHGFKKAMVGLSGGIDSAVTCCLAKEAAGEKNVMGLSMPSKYSTKDSVDLARKLAQNLGIGMKTIPISAIYDAYLGTLEKELGGDETEEIEIYHQNIQARIRGNILMAFSNRFGHLVLATGNKSEAMMGYCTLYGDTVGGLAVISDILKAGVYQLAGYINRSKEIIPEEIIERAPSAELKPGQKDEDSLPPYEVLDEILHLYLEEKLSVDELNARGFPLATVEQVISAIKNTEYKRKQCPPGIKIF